MDTNSKPVGINEKAAYANLAEQVVRSEKTHLTIVTCGRGGLSVAQKLAYLLNIPVKVVTQDQLTQLGSSDLFVDDIVCTGETIGTIPRGTDIATLVQRNSANHKANFSGLIIAHEKYVKFSWEA